MEHFFSPNSGEDQKKKKQRKGIHQKFPPSGGLRSHAHQSQIIGGDADEDHTQIIGGDTVKLLRGIYPLHPPPRVSAPLLSLLLTKCGHIWSSTYNFTRNACKLNATSSKIFGQWKFCLI